MTDKAWKIVFENVGEQISDYVHKMEVPGGWLYRTMLVSKRETLMNTCFISGEKCADCSFPLVKICVNCSEVTRKEYKLKESFICKKEDVHG